MGIGVSIFLMAVGGILAWAVNIESSAVNLDIVGGVLMVVGALGLLFSLLFWSSFAPFGRDERYHDETAHTHSTSGHRHVA